MFLASDFLGSSCFVGADRPVNGGTFYGTDISPLQFAATYEAPDRIRVRIIDPSMQRFEV
jgi:hypothetical protein